MVSVTVALTQPPSPMNRGPCGTAPIPPIAPCAEISVPPEEDTGLAAEGAMEEQPEIDNIRREATALKKIFGLYMQISFSVLSYKKTDIVPCFKMVSVTVALPVYLK